MLYIAKTHWWTENTASVKILNDRKIHHFVHPFLFSSLFSEMFWLFSQSYFLTILHDQSRYGARLNKARDSHAMDSKRATSSVPPTAWFSSSFFFFFITIKKRSLKRLWHHVTDSDTHIKSLLSTKDNDKKKKKYIYSVYFVHQYIMSVFAFRTSKSFQEKEYGNDRKIKDEQARRIILASFALNGKGYTLL